MIQKIFRIIWLTIDNYDPTKEKLFPWMMQITRCAAIDETKSLYYKTLKQTSLTGEEASHAIENFGFKKAIHQLEDEQKTLIDLLYYKGLTCEQIAETLSMPEGTVKTKIRTALSALRAVLCKKTVNIKEYIESGIIEQIVLGLATEAEQQEFDALCIQYPEIVEARRSFELALEDQMMKEAVTPPAHLKEKIFLSLNIPRTNDLNKTEREYKKPVLRRNVWKWMTAICILVLAGTIYWTFSVNDKYQKLLKANREIGNQFDHSRHANSIIALQTIVQKPSVKWSLMVEPNNQSHCMAHIYWNSLSKNTFLLLGNIPKPVSDKQFQLWALVDNRPVNLGIFDAKKEGQLIKMKNIHNAKAFAITIEPRGGSSAPNTKATYAVGEL